MKRTIFFLAAAGCIFVACQRKSAPTVADRTNVPTAPTTTVPVATETPVISAADLEAGHQIYSAGKCSKCHAPKPVDNWTVEGWKPILKSMIPKAKLDSVQTMQLTAWVHANAKK